MRGSRVFSNPVTYNTDDHATKMPSLILAPAGEDKSTISLHFLGLCFLGIAPSGLRCILGDLTSCLHILPNCTSCCRYSDIIVEYLIGILSEHEYNEHLRLKPIQKPFAT